MNVAVKINYSLLGDEVAEKIIELTAQDSEWYKKKCDFIGKFIVEVARKWHLNERDAEVKKRIREAFNKSLKKRSKAKKQKTEVSHAEKPRTKRLYGHSLEYHERCANAIALQRHDVGETIPDL